MAKRKLNPEKTMNVFAIMKQIADSTGEGLVLIASYSGGGDSGYVELDEDFTSELTKMGASDLIEVVENTIHEGLGYGSWAGEFSAAGEVYWNPKEKRFEAEGYETVEEPRNFEFTF